jgi:hypothetical protein
LIGGQRHFEAAWKHDKRARAGPFRVIRSCETSSRSRKRRLADARVTGHISSVDHTRLR